MARTIIAAAALFIVAAPAFAGGKSDIQCRQYGEGFVYSADTGMCIKVSGDLRADFGVNSRGHGLSGSNLDTTFDARGTSEFGPVRAVIGTGVSKY